MKIPATLPENRNPHLRWLYAFTQFMSRLFCITYFDFRVYGTDRLPRRGPVVLASNHQSFLDPWLVGIMLPRQMAYLARDSLFRVPVLGWYLRAVNSIPIERAGYASRKGMEMSIEALKAGRPLILFPEGTRSPDGKLGRLRRGIDLVVRRGGARVVPVYVDGTFEAWPRQNTLPIYAPIRIYVGEPFPERPGAVNQPTGGQKNGGDSAESMEDRPARDEKDAVPGPLPDGSEKASRRGSDKSSAAALLEALGEAYRVLEGEARKHRGTHTYRWHSFKL